MGRGLRWRRSKRGVSSQGICDISFYVFIYLNYGLCVVYVFYECDKLDVSFFLFFFIF